MLSRVLRPDSSQIPESSHGPFVVSACIYMVITSSKSKDQPSKMSILLVVVVVVS